jgi:deoxyribonuclease-4
MTRKIGVHTSIAGGLHLSLQRANSLKCNTLQIFSHNPRGWAVKSISEGEVSTFRSLRTRLNMAPLYVHASYLINIASRDRDLQKKSVALLAVEMDRADLLGAEYVILHPGSASGEDERIARKRASEALREVASMGQWKAGLLLENTAGERGDISYKVSNLSDMMSYVMESLIAGICIDTCHAFAAGYDVGSERGIHNISDEIEKYIGLGKLVGLGKIGMGGLRLFLNYSLFKDIPLILETPRKNETDDYQNLRKVRRMIRSEGS